MTQRNKRRSAEKPTAVKFDRSDSGMAGGVLILGGIVAVGAVAGAIAALRRKTSNKTDDEYGKRGDGNSKRTPRENGNGGGLRSLLQIHGKQFRGAEDPLKSTELSEGEEEDYDDNMNVIRGEVEPLKEPGYVEDISESLLRTDDACSNGSISSSVATEHEAIWPEDINESKIDEFSPNVADKLLEEINEVKSDEIDGAPPDVADKFPEKSNESKIEEINGVPPHLVDKLSEEINKAKVEEEIHGDFPRVTEKFSYEIELKTKDFGRTYSDSLVEGEEIKENAGDKVKNPLLNEEKETEEKEIVELEEKGTAVREESELIHREERDIIVDREETEQDAEKLQFVNKAKNGERAGFIMEMKSYLKEEGVWQWNLATIVWAWVLVAAVVLAISLLKRRNTGYGISV
ncbi:uncharacterized protein LOC18431313 [Amborella trichopoda]|uniref:uncharacterized protein LOC18431313 n=1 Tax=Amborella trichopoda TaxID=13333 RepID=UPI0005D44174|nr:uncharacterized protein LOC18431313 [Amborella trichopoda]|eukprot:XP_011622233.1 uncharacterized protein LOC18431313 [Amborella trichopoda]